jgi:hypothetical protein
MSEDRTAATRRRARRPTEAAARLDRLRKRNADQLEAQRDAERRIETALKNYVDLDVSISVVEQERDEKVSDLERQIEQAREAARLKVEQLRVQQAIAVWQLNSAGRTVEQIAELLEMPQKEARRLVSAGRTAAKPERTDASDETTTPSVGAAAADQQPPTQQPPPAPPEAGVARTTGSERDRYSVTQPEHAARPSHSEPRQPTHVTVPHVPDGTDPTTA